MTIPTMNEDRSMPRCQPLITYEEIQHILAQGPCIEYRLKRHDDNQANSTNHIYALQSTINDQRQFIHDHHRWIFYLLNSTIKVTELEQHYAEQHSKIKPHWKSWRDVCLLLLMAICIGIPICFVIRRVRLLDVLTSYLLRRHQHKLEQKQNQIMEKKVKISDPSATDTPTTPVYTIKQDVLRYTHASDSS
ncbi:unnamed protein product [Adineta steineri]|uniref:Uncharacterized protein n=1 Tax=Adineta steineri TaxID=433720 RepID=A0A816DXK1_9BILA|nr:unnamed protein product [Adineta steineri]CAF1641658.1 unnamed protein product [Adineta steineri]